MRAFRKVLWVLLIGYLTFILCYTVICRESFPDYRYNFFPFWSYAASAKKNILDYGEPVEYLDVYSGWGTSEDTLWQGVVVENACDYGFILYEYRMFTTSFQERFLRV